ncbi:GNAT family N-acetyltransferase [Mycolicibacterium helvum]|uniref:N-acetyltransferase n=1 Tax=Mycolicibacterium helvum TaxID=1534349 RepID=A0A7I7T2Q8_9MYCO|nr:GNAT family N-acetyltransferase [Mycolicibacterium helvum]BBY62749.1 N-acetyltransferase [Mycolicibacterium helvum]
MAFDIRPAVAADLDDAARTLAAAFDAYAWTRWSIPEDGYADRLERLQRLYLGYALDQGVVLVSDNMHGVIALLPPAASPPTADFQEQVARLHGQRLAAVAQVETPTPPESAWSLATLGVHPRSQGEGLGSALVQTGLAVIDGLGASSVALETSDERNVRLYERAGFTVTVTTAIEQGPVVYSMFRPASE